MDCACPGIDGLAVCEGVVTGRTGGDELGNRDCPGTEGTGLCEVVEAGMAADVGMELTETGILVEVTLGEGATGDVDKVAAAIISTGVEEVGVVLGEGGGGESETACNVACGFESNEMAGNEGRVNALAAGVELEATGMLEEVTLGEGATGDVDKVAVAIIRTGAETVGVVLGEGGAGESETGCNVACGAELNEMAAKAGKANTLAAGVELGATGMLVEVVLGEGATEDVDETAAPITTGGVEDVGVMLGEEDAGKPGMPGIEGNGVCEVVEEGMVGDDGLGDGVFGGIDGIAVCEGVGAAGDADTAWSVACGAELNEIAGKEERLGKGVCDD